MTVGPGRLVVRLESSGGLAFLPGLSRPFTADSDDLEPADAERLRTLLNGSAFFTRPAHAAPPATAAADHRTYTLTVSDGLRSHTVTATEPVTDPTLRDLIDQLLSWRNQTR